MNYLGFVCTFVFEKHSELKVKQVMQLGEHAFDLVK